MNYAYTVGVVTGDIYDAGVVLPIMMLPMQLVVLLALLVLLVALFQIFYARYDLCGYAYG